MVRCLKTEQLNWTMLMSCSVLDVFLHYTVKVLVVLSKKQQGADCMYFVILKRQIFLFKCESEACSLPHKNVIRLSSCDLKFKKINESSQPISNCFLSYLCALHLAVGRVSELQTLAAVWFTCVFWKRIVTNLFQFYAGGCADFHTNKSVHFISLILSKSCDLPATEISLLTQFGM